MALADRILQLKLVADVSDINRGLDKAEGRLKGFGRRAGSFLKIGGLFAATQGIELVTDAIGDAWEGFREGERVAAQLANTWKRMRLPARGLQRAIDRISARTKVLGTSDDEAIEAFRTLITQTGDQGKAYNRLRIAQDLVASGSAPNLKAALKIITAAAKGSAKVVDQFGLRSRTAAGRVRELGDRVKGAADKSTQLRRVEILFNALGEDLESIVGSLSRGDIEGAIDGIVDAGRDLQRFLQGTLPGFEKLRKSLIGHELDDFVEGLRKLGAQYGPMVIGMLRSFQGAAQEVQRVLQNTVIPVLVDLTELMAPSVKGGLAAVVHLAQGAFEAFAALLRGDFSGALDMVSRTIQAIADDVSTAFEGTLTELRKWITPLQRAAENIGTAILGGIGRFVDDVARNVGGWLGDVWQKLADWLPRIVRKAQSIGQGILGALVALPGRAVDALAQIMRSAINHILRIWNDFSIPKFEVQGFQVWPRIDFPDIPLLGSGGVVTRPTLAVVGERGPEAVMPLRGGLAGLTINVNAGVGDPVAIGREVERVLNAYQLRKAV